MLLFLMVRLLRGLGWAGGWAIWLILASVVGCRAALDGRVVQSLCKHCLSDVPARCRLRARNIRPGFAETLSAWVGSPCISRQFSFGGLAGMGAEPPGCRASPEGDAVSWRCGA